MRSRTPPERLGREAEEAFRSAMRSLGIGTSDSADDHGPDFTLVLSDGTTLVVEVKASSIPTIDRVRAVAEHERRGSLTVVVADQIPAPVRGALDAAGIGWLDRRGHLRLVAPGWFIDTDVPASPRREVGRATKRAPISGRSGLASAAALLMRPDDPMTVADIARGAHLNRSSITRALAAIADAHLAQRLDRGRYRPLIPELFWSLADVWPQEATTIRWRASAYDERLGLRGDDLTKPGWAAAGVPVAVAWGAPLVATADYPIHLYAPDEQLVRLAETLHADGTGTQALLSVDPIGLITSERYHAESLDWPAAHPLFCALDLTNASRDREALEQWTPPEGFARVW